MEAKNRIFPSHTENLRIISSFFLVSKIYALFPVSKIKKQSPIFLEFRLVAALFTHQIGSLRHS